jgi:NO-binding membrane sensor protein with MHYT domain
MMMPAGTPLAGSYDPLVVALSVVIAVAASMPLWILRDA